ncbi:MAG: putative toxin-antitoxin system toxin component, PIN family [Spirochaetales bacterium]|nr:putative toxin-antitoxin system toxin component, PIN family [Spirochaetales bacterium]
MRVVMDTSVLYQALRSARGASHRILRMISAGKLELALSTSAFEEYAAVLSRRSSLADLRLSRKDVDNVLEFIAYLCIPVTIHFGLRPNLQDEGDNLFVELAFASQCRYLIKSNVRDFRSGDLKFDSFEAVTPAEFLRIWRKTYES